ncbi:MAG: GNAT family N-acetyltransferase [Anaerolineales bacterium]|nr:GNAT family N-acetyltransferase [Anaerolineales bacterium]
MNENNSMQLPAGYKERPADKADAERVTTLLNMCAVEFIGEQNWDTHRLVKDWGYPDLTLEKDTRIVLAQDGELVAYIDVMNKSPHIYLNSVAAVHPNHRQKGIGSALLHWSEWRSCQSVDLAPSGARIAIYQEIPTTNEAAVHLLEGNGFLPVRYTCWMKIDLEQDPIEPSWPDGIKLRTFNRSTDLPLVALTDHEAFKDHWGYVERDVECLIDEWEHFITDNPHFDPSLWFLAVEKDEIVGICLCFKESPGNPDLGSIDTVAVRKPWRRRGVAQALLQHSFCEFFRRGIKQATLDADTQNLTGAIELYRKVGMYMVHKSAVLEKTLRPGYDLVKRS